ncbi:hypothetical protein Ctob_009430 [Chrysochromulina tobinii]|uniref:Uncharacterized protein n=1 Tax=Chrysochromulina tobinii TaxID=1460289 RepID=A0A0M0JNK4_9EUKA|nr:hypothetical protein Ctob_009430 [Chrysochromulina tobinii]|eukprot:KOO27897.1 hypothetical protein Ctob_009430 [Chrysochromulina sp. CCMP291]
MRLARALRLCIAAQRHRSTLRPHQHACCEEADFASLGPHQRDVLMFGVARKLTLRVSVWI